MRASSRVCALPAPDAAGRGASGMAQRTAPPGVVRPVSPHYLYVHVPFCTRRCSYCDFAVTAVATPPVAAWLESLERELALRAAAAEWSPGMALETIYVGGGTPSLLGAGAMARLAGLLRRWFHWTAEVEWTAEANPESLSAELAEDWRAAGVNRISLGVQTWHEESLHWMGRLHGRTGPGRAFAAARSAGFDNLSLDLIFGLPARLGRDWDADLEQAAELAPEHISLYGLTAEPATPLGRWVRDGRERMTDDIVYEREYLRAFEVLDAAGYSAYEVSNFARPGRASRHNQAYWRHAPYLGIGPGSHSFLPPDRSWNVRDWDAYALRLREGRDPTEGRERLGEQELRLERIWLGLRCESGLLLRDLAAPQQERVRFWQGQAWARLDHGRIRLTPAGWLQLDRLALDLDAAVDGSAATATPLGVLPLEQPLLQP